MDSPPSAPPVVAVVVAEDPGPWFEEALAALGRQDYPNLAVLVVDAGSSVDPAPRVALALPSAYVRRAERGKGFAGAANDVLSIVSGAAFLLFCHDDVAPEPDAVRKLVEEALRSNAGVVGPKIVEWDRPSRLLDVGLTVDKTGASTSLAERGELDQEQHDAVRDVFAVSSACMLVRSDLFGVIDGFDEVLTDYGADVDLCWRAQVAGARVIVAPAARVRHREGGAEQPEADPGRPMIVHRNHLRSMFKNYSAPHLLRVTPQAAVLTIGEVLFALFRRQWADARHLVGAWLWNLRSLPRLRSARKRVAESRAVIDTDVRRLQAHGSVRVTSYLQRRLRAEDRAQALVNASQELVSSVGRGPAQVAALIAGISVVAWLVGMRDLFTDRLAAVGDLAPIPAPRTLLAHWVSGWRTTGAGTAGAAPTAFAWLSIGGLLVLGKTALLQTVLVLGTWPVAALGTWRLTSAFRSTLGRLVAVIVYATIPLSYNSLARGRFGALVVYAALPWLLLGLVRAAGLAPFVDGSGGDEHARDVHRAPGARQRRYLVLATGVGLALASAFAPVVSVVLLLTSVALVAGSGLAGGFPHALRGLGATASALVVAAVLLVPWVFELVLPGGGWATTMGVAPDAAFAPTLGELLRFQVGPLGAGPLGWVFYVPAALPLLLGREWRLAWAIRLWTVAVVCVLAAWAGARGWLPLQLEAPDPLLVPAALALALAAALGAVTFELDLAAYRFGWRQVAAVAAGAGVVLGLLPVIAGARDGRFQLSDQEPVRSLSWMAPTASEGAFRVLWVGSPEVLPIDGWPLGDGLAFATSRNGAPTFVERFPGRSSDATEAMARAISTATDADTAQLGHLLAPLGVRYLVLPTGDRTGEEGPPAHPLPDGLVRALASQIDLRIRPSDPAVTVYENTAWGPVRALLESVPAEAAEPGRQQGADLSESEGVLHSGRVGRYRGPVPSTGPVLVAESPSDRWKLTVAGETAERRSAFGVANVFDVDESGQGLLEYRTPILYSAAQAVQIALWVVALRALWRMRRRSRSTAAAPAPHARLPVGARTASTGATAGVA